MSKYAHRFIATDSGTVVGVIELGDPWRADFTFVSGVQRFLNKHFKDGNSIRMERIELRRPVGPDAA